MSEYALQMRQISKTYGRLRANDTINLDVKRGTIHALAGENGAGKSTLMKILFGLVKADENPDPASGIFVNGLKVAFTSPLDAIKSGVGMVQQHFAIAGPLSALDNIILGAEPTSGFIIDRQKAEADLDAISGSLLNVPWSDKAENLSIGMQQRIEILKLLFRRADILILDEPTAVLTPLEVKVFFQLLKTLKSEGKTLILITHKLQEVLDLCDEVTVLKQGQVTGRFSTKGLTQNTIIHAMIGRDLKPLHKENIKIGPEILAVKNLSVDKGVKGSLKEVNFSIHENEIVGVAGVEGNGQQALVEALLNLNKKTGEIHFKGQDINLSTQKIRETLGFGLISEDRHTQSLWLEGSVKENMTIGFTHKLARWGFLGSQATRKNAEKFLAHYEVKMESVDQPINFLSGGNQQKIIVAREVTARDPQLLIASQPTRGVDVGAIEFIHQQILILKRKGAGILLISSEIEELCALSNRIIVLFEGRIVDEFEGPLFDIEKIGRAMTCARDEIH